MITLAQLESVAASVFNQAEPDPLQVKALTDLMVNVRMYGLAQVDPQTLEPSIKALFTAPA